jgi:hypothetical protein
MAEAYIAAHTCITASYTEARPLFKKPLEQQGNMLTEVSAMWPANKR